MPTLTVVQNGKSKEISFEKTVSLSNILTQYGYFVPHLCGGKGTCKKCTVVLDGKEVLACRTLISEDATVELGDNEDILTAATDGETGKLTQNCCLCLDIGTTTLALALVSLDEKKIICTETAPNPQRAYGADVISRIESCTKHGAEVLQRPLINTLKTMVGRIFGRFGINSAEKMYVAGNTTMLHLFLGVDCSSMGVSPYTPTFIGEKRVDASALGFENIGQIITLSGISAFVGADIVAGIDAVGLPCGEKYRILLDLGTNAEIALFSQEGIICTAAAAGPCFEGANISCGMSASEGAVYACDGQGNVSVIGGGDGRGICATGLIDVIANAVKRGDIDETGYMENERLPVCKNVSLTAKDIREFQLAKSAIRAGIECLMRQAGVDDEQIEGLYVAGGFSMGLNRENAASVGLIPVGLAEKTVGVNNASLQGTVKYACDGEKGWSASVDAKYVDLSCDVNFAELFMKYMTF